MKHANIYGFFTVGINFTFNVKNTVSFPDSDKPQVFCPILASKRDLAKAPELVFQAISSQDLHMQIIRILHINHKMTRFLT